MGLTVFWLPQWQQLWNQWYGFNQAYGYRFSVPHPFSWENSTWPSNSMGRKCWHFYRIKLRRINYSTCLQIWGMKPERETFPTLGENCLPPHLAHAFTPGPLSLESRVFQTPRFQYFTFTVFLWNKLQVWPLLCYKSKVSIFLYGIETCGLALYF